MIFAILGEKGIGKSSLLKKIHTKLAKQYPTGGIITEGQSERYFVDLKNNKRIPFRNEGREIKIGRFNIAKKSLSEVEEILKNSIQFPIIFIDEIGRLESEKQGLFSGIKHILDNKTIRQVIIAVVREDVFDKICEIYNIFIGKKWLVTLDNRELLVDAIVEDICLYLNTMNI